MRFELVNLADQSTAVRVNLWNWQPTVELIRHLGMIDDDRLKKMRSNACHVRVSAEEAHAIGEKLRREVCARMQPGQRVTHDLRIMSESDGGEFEWENPESNYCATYEWLQKFVDFCRISQGFEVN